MSMLKSQNGVRLWEDGQTEWPTAGRQPLVGAALQLQQLPSHLAWLGDGERDLEIQDTTCPAFLDGDWQALVRSSASLLSGYRGRIGIHGPHKGLSLLAEDPAVAAVVVQRLRKALLIGRDLGASHMVIHSPFTTFGSPFLTHRNAQARERDLDVVRFVIGRVLPLAEETGCQLVIENVYDTNPGPLVELVHSLASPYVGLSVDVGHAYLTAQIGGPPPDQWIRGTSPWLSYLHLQDTDGCADRHWRVGQGNINWHAVFAALGELRRQPRLLIEVDDPQDIRGSARWLEQHGLAH